MEWIVDRTQADIMLGNGKGYYTYRDLNRVEQGVQELYLLAEKLDVHLPISVKLDWGQSNLFSVEHWPVESQLRRYMENVRMISNAFCAAVQLPNTMENLTWEGANQIERALYQAEQQIQGILMTIRFSGEFFAGEENAI